MINAGVPGDTTADALDRLERDVLSRPPRMVLLTLGGNDLKNCVPKKQAFTHLRAIVEAIQKAGALVVSGGVEIPLRPGVRRSLPGAGRIDQLRPDPQRLRGHHGKA